MKQIAILLASALLMNSCSEALKENAEDECGPITANIHSQTRTSMGPGEDGIYKVLWSDGDGIIVSDGMIEGVYTTIEGGNSSAVFIPKSRIPMDFSKGVIAGYPVENMFLGEPDPDEDIYFTIPSTQQYKVDSFDEASMPMVSDIAYEPVLNFRNTAGVMKIVISGEESVSLKSITIKTNEILSGDLCYNSGTQTYNMEYAMTPYYQTVLDCGNGVEISSAEKSFHIVVPHQTYTSLSFILQSTDGRQHVFNMKEGRTLTVERSSVVTLPLKYSTFGTSTAPEISMSTTYITFTGIGVNVSMKNVDSYYSSFQSKKSFDQEMSDGSLLESLEWKTAYTSPMSYRGSISGFQEEFGDMLIEPGHEYVFWIVPHKEDGSYTEDDIESIVIQTKSYTPGGSVTLWAEDLEADYTGLSVRLIASDNVEIVYNILMPSEEIAAYPDEQDLIDLLLSGSAYFFEATNDIVVRKFLSPGTRYTLIALAVDKNGRYGPLFKEEYETRSIDYNDLNVSIVQDIEALRKDQTIRWSTENGSATGYRYIMTATDRHLWTGTLESSVKKAEETMVLDPGLYYITKTDSTEARLEMENGKEYIFVILAVDSAGGCSTASHWRFTY